MKDLKQQVEEAAQALWGRPLPAKTGEAVAECELVNKVLMQFLDQFPVTAAMQFAVAYGWALRERAEAQARVVAQ